MNKLKTLDFLGIRFKSFHLNIENYSRTDKINYWLTRSTNISLELIRNNNMDQIINTLHKYLKRIMRYTIRD